jgi:tRNA U55 pseudouridine synthase TruB
LLDVADALSIDEAVDAAEANALSRVLLTPAAALGDLPEIRVDDAMVSAVKHGRELPDILMPDGMDPNSSIRIGDKQGSLVAVYRRGQTGLEPEVVLS